MARAEVSLPENDETFWEIATAVFVILPFAISLWTIIHYLPLVQT